MCTHACGFVHLLATQYTTRAHVRDLHAHIQAQIIVYVWYIAMFIVVVCSMWFVISGFGFGGTAGASQTGVGGLGCLGGGLTTGQSAVDATAAAIAQQNQQQLLQLTSSPYGDSPLFHNLRQVMSSFMHAVSLTCL